MIQRIKKLNLKEKEEKMMLTHTYQVENSIISFMELKRKKIKIFYT